MIAHVRMVDICLVRPGPEAPVLETGHGRQVMEQKANGETTLRSYDGFSPLVAAFCQSSEDFVAKENVKKGCDLFLFIY